LSKELDKLVDILKTLRGPDGCPWDKEQTHQSLLSCMVDETYEFIEAAENGDNEHMKEELGDVLLQIGFHAQLASEENKFTLEEVIADLNSKMIRRHPHVFGSTNVENRDQVIRNWIDIKKSEKKESKDDSALSNIPPGLPALFRAEKMQRKAARVGFDWDNMKPVLDKVEEEFSEFREALEMGNTKHAEEELGDILFALVNVARHKKICAEEALRGTIKKFEKRFKYIEQSFKKQKKDINEATLEQMDLLWEESKRSLK